LGEFLDLGAPDRSCRRVPSRELSAKALACKSAAQQQTSKKPGNDRLLANVIDALRPDLRPAEDVQKDDHVKNALERPQGISGFTIDAHAESREKQ
jgi:hypothetical protein